MVDTLRADRLSVYGYHHPTSPQLEKLATDAVVFEQVTAQSPWTKPSVASVLTGLEPSQHGVHDFGDVLHSGLTTWAEMLRLQGFESIALVANGLVGKKFGFDQGFTHHETLPVTTPASRLTELAIAKLAKRDKSRPFFLYLHPLDPHLPYAPPSSWRDQSAVWHGLKTSSPGDYPELGTLELESFGKIMFGLYCCAASGLDPELSSQTLAYIRSLYDGEVAFVDDSFGRLVDWLKSEGLYDDTLIVFTSDHGEELVERGWLGHLHGLHEELVHVPLLIKWPRSQHAGKRVTETYQHIDILPTVLRALGLRPRLDAEGFPHSASAAAYFELKAGADAQEMGQSSTDFAEIGAGVREGDWKLTHYDASVRPVDLRALYNLKSDPAEMDNLILKDPVRALFLEAELARHRARPSRFVSSKFRDAETTNLLRSLDYLR
jgi:arylsulfatase A-like enzyme